MAMRAVDVEVGSEAVAERRALVVDASESCVHRGGRRRDDRAVAIADRLRKIRRHDPVDRADAAERVDLVGPEPARFAVRESVELLEALAEDASRGNDVTVASTRSHPSSQSSGVGALRAERELPRAVTSVLRTRRVPAYQRGPHAGRRLRIVVRERAGERRLALLDLSREGLARERAEVGLIRAGRDRGDPRVCHVSAPTRRRSFGAVSPEDRRHRPQRAGRVGESRNTLISRVVRCS